MWWYTSGFGSPVSRAEGVGYAQELISRLTHSKRVLDNVQRNVLRNPQTIQLV
jgi:hypothetical protein